MVSSFCRVTLAALAATCMAVAAHADPLPQAERVMLRSTESLPAVDHVVVHKTERRMLLLQKCYELITAKGYSVVNIDSTVCLENPKIMKFVPAMQQAIAGILYIAADDISIKATTTETN